MAIRFKCASPECGKPLKVRDEATGKRIRCPACGHTQEVPAPSAKADDDPTSLAARFLGANVERARAARLPVVNDAIENPLSLQLLFDRPLALDADDVMQSLREFHPSMARATVEIEPDSAAKGTPYGLVAWGRHVIRFLGFDLPMPSDPVERCVQGAHYPEDMKLRAREHCAHMILFYGGYEEDALEQYVALASFCGVLHGHGAIVTMNESAWSSLPTGVLAADGAKSDHLELLRVGFPLPLLFCGFVKYNLPDSERVWMRTYGAHLLGLPDLAFRAKGHFQGQFVLDTFNDVLRYLLDSSATLSPGHTMQLGEDFFVRWREPKRRGEEFLESEGELLVMEKIRPDEINR